MANELNGTTCLLKWAVGVNEFDIAGQMEVTSSVLGNAIDISTKSDDDFIKLLNGELAAKGASITANIIYSNNAAFESIRDLAVNGTAAAFVMDFTGSAFQKITFVGIPTAMSDSLPVGDKVSTSITILSLGPVVYGSQF